MSTDTPEQLDGLKAAGHLVAHTLRELRKLVRPGVTTAELDAVGLAVLEQHGARSAPQLVYKFPGVNCISLNDEAVHGIPGPRAVRDGDLVKLDVTAELDGYIADAAATVASAGRRRASGGAAESALGRRSPRPRAGRLRDRPRDRPRGAQPGLPRPAGAARPRRRPDDPRAAVGLRVGGPDLQPAADRGAGLHDRADHRGRVDRVIARPDGWSCGRPTARSRPTGSTRSS